MRRVSHCDQCDRPFDWTEVDGVREPVLWGRLDDPYYVYCSPECTEKGPPKPKLRLC
jgi:hypothetical protein